MVKTGVWAFRENIFGPVKDNTIDLLPKIVVVN